MVAFRLFILTAVALCVSGCDGGEPEVSYRGISAENAVTLLDKASTEDEKLRVLERVDSDSQFGFDWVYFWKSIRDNDYINGMGPATENYLFQLGEKFCESSSFDIYAQVVLKRWNHYPKVVRPDRTIPKGQRLLFGSVSGNRFGNGGGVQYFLHEFRSPFDYDGHRIGTTLIDDIVDVELPFGD